MRLYPSGIKFNPLYPKVQDIFIEDLAHGISLECRWGNHVPKFFSVAQHSVNVANVIRFAFGGTKDEQAAGLLHDAYEAIITDIPHDLKRTKEFLPARLAEARGQYALTVRFGLKQQAFEQNCVHVADQIMASNEAVKFFGSFPTDWPKDWPAPMDNIDLKDCQIVLTPWSPKKARAEFMKEFHRLFKPSKSSKDYWEVRK